jgi:5-hydroxyisourate hydrolase
MTGISTHVLNITTGRPLAGLKVELFDMATQPPTRINSTRTNADGRTDAPMLSAKDARTGHFELRFHRRPPGFE